MTKQIIKNNLLDRDFPKEKFLKDSRFPIHLVLDNIRSAFNVGSAFRTSDAAYVEKIYLTGISTFPPNKKLAKTALGATDVVPWQHYPTTKLAIEELQQKKIPICIVELTSQSTNFWQYKFPTPVALVFGNEITGVSDEVLPMADSYVHIPMYGKKTTLNVATTIGMVLFEVLRQWQLENAK